jgi:MoxR-like ATPase
MTNDFNQTDNYVLSNELEESIKIAELTKRPLLIKGEPGTGKTLLAEYYAKKKNYPIYRWHIKSTTVAGDGLYFYDAITRLNDSRFQDNTQRDVNNINDYIRFEAMGQSFKSDVQSVLLIDEIDKADVEFPNDLLLELDKMQFNINETGETVKAIHRPVVFITSNSEKELPDAFLRRCIFHYIDFPNEVMMKDIVHAHYPEIEKDLLNNALSIFYKLRGADELRKKPSTSELIDWINILLHQGVDLKKIKSIPFLGSLLKNEEDVEKLK